MSEGQEFEQLELSFSKILHMPITHAKISKDQAAKVIWTSEGHYSDVKSQDIQPAKLTKTISAFANTDGGDLYIGIDEPEVEGKKSRVWRGFTDDEAANGHLQIFEQLFPLGTDFQYEFIEADGFPGLILHILVAKTQGIVKASNQMPYIRRGAASYPVDTPEKVKRLEYTKGIASFEVEPVNAPLETVTQSQTVETFIRDVVPSSTPYLWLRKQLLLTRDDRATVAATLLFSDEPQAVLPKRCGVKVYRYKTKELAGFREALAFTPKTVEGCLYKQIKAAVQLTREIAETIPKLGEDSLEKIVYPDETLHEIITNAVIHRDYSIADDVHIRIFDNRIEVQSPGRLPAHVTEKNFLNERAARNGAIVRILNKFPEPPNQDVGEGLKTAFSAMNKLGLKEPVLTQTENDVLVIIRHEPLASPEEAIMDFLEGNPKINNKKAREITHVSADHQMKTIFKRMENKGLIEQMPGTRTSNTAYRKKEQDKK